MSSTGVQGSGDLPPSLFIRSQVRFAQHTAACRVPRHTESPAYRVPGIQSPRHTESHTPPRFRYGKIPAACNHVDQFLSCGYGTQTPTNFSRYLAPCDSSGDRKAIALRDSHRCPRLPILARPASSRGAHRRARLLPDDHPISPVQVRSPSGEMSEAKRRIQNDFSRYFNRKRRPAGPLVRGRFFSKPVYSDRY
jgi:hypothetical protein